MEYARDSASRRRWTWQLGLEAARDQTWVCFECGVPVDVVRMPGLAKTSAVWRARPGFSEFYFRGRKGEPHRGCVFEPRLVAAVIEKRIIRSSAGRPGAPPAAISFDREVVRQAAIDGDGADGDGRTPAVRGRYLDGDGPIPSRGNRMTVSSSIERAALAHATRSVPSYLPLAVQGLPATCQTYETVFQPIDRAQAGLSRIWFGTLRFMVPPVVDGDLLRLQTYDREVVLDRTSWSSTTIRAFDAELSICLDWVRDRWFEGERGAAPRIYVLARCVDADGPIVVCDPRMLSVAVSVNDGRGRAAAAPPAAGRRRRMRR